MRTPKYLLQTNLFQYLLIYGKNKMRQFLYELYRIYKKHLKDKFHIYDLQTIDVIHTLPNDAVCIDIGVNEGQILNFLYKQCPKGKILAIEPIPDLINYLQLKYNWKRVMVQQVALSDENSEAIFYYFPKRHSLSGLKLRNIIEVSGLTPQQIIVPVRKLDDIFKEAKLDFIKIDVEGAEYNVLSGARNILKKFKPIIIFEAGLGGLEYYNHTPNELFELLHFLSYKVSTLQNYLSAKQHFSREEFVNNFLKGYDYQYIAYA